MRFAAGLLPILFFGLDSTAAAAPKLRLTSASVGPVSITQGSNGNNQSLEAYNAGDGTLSLAATSSASWVNASVGAVRPCLLQDGNCYPVNFAFQTSALAKGTYTAAVTLTDANALDAPQIVTVTVQIGGGVPDSAILYVAPNGSSDDVRFSTNGQLTPSATTQNGGSWLSLSVDGSGSFRFVVPYKISGRHLQGMPEGTYNGSVSISGSGLPAENKTVPVQLVVTSQPIARAAPNVLNLRLATGAPVLQTGVTVFNGGLGTLNLNGVTTSTTSGGNWLSATASGNAVVVTTNSSGLSPGSYSGVVTVNSNAANSSLTIPVLLSIVAASAPVSTVDGVLNQGNYDTAIAPGGIAVVNGEQFSNQDPARYSQAPLDQTLGGVRVLVNDQAAPLFATSYNRVSFQVPYEAAAGEAVVRVERDGQRGNGTTVQVSPRAPRILQQGDYGLFVNGTDGTLATLRGSKPGEVVTVFAVGLGVTTPQTASGNAAPVDGPLARVTPAPRVIFGNVLIGSIVLDTVFAGLTPNSVGLYQVTFVVPPDAPAGDVAIALEGDDYRSNTVLLPIRN